MECTAEALGQAIYANASADAGAAEGGSSAGGADDVVDAEVVDETDDGEKK